MNHVQKSLVCDCIRQYQIFLLIDIIYTIAMFLLTDFENLGSCQ